MKLINIFISNNTTIEYYDLSKIDYKILYERENLKLIKQFDNSFLYVFDDFVFSELAGKNKELIDSIIEKKVIGNCSKWIFDRAKENIIRGNNLKKQYNGFTI